MENPQLETLKEQIQDGNSVKIELHLNQLNPVGTKVLMAVLQFLNDKEHIDYFDYEVTELKQDDTLEDLIRAVVKKLRKLDEEEGAEFIRLAIPNTESCEHMYRLVYHTDLKAKQIARILINDAIE